MKVYRKVCNDGFEMENCRLSETLAGLLKGSVSAEMVLSDHQNSGVAIPNEVCTVDDFTWPLWRDGTKV